MATIKKGTYRFNDEIFTTSSAKANINFTCSSFNADFGITVTANCNYMNNGYTGTDSIELSYYLVSTVPDFGLSSDFYIVYTNPEGWRNAQYGIDLQTITIIEDAEVSDDFYTWFSSNASLVTATVTYNSSIIAALNGGETKKLKTA